MTVLAAPWTFPNILNVIIWGLMILLNVWIFQKTKAKGNMLMIVGAGCLALSALLVLLSSAPSEFAWLWLPVIGAAVLLAGFYFTVQPMVQAHVDALKKRIQDATASKAKPSGEGGGDAGGEAKSGD